LRPRRPRFEPVRPVVRQERINEQIRVPRVRLIDDDGAQLGIKTADEAREYAYAKGLDLVEVAAQADPPVTRVMDFGKWKYEQEQKAKLARKHQTNVQIKEIKLRPKIGVHDYETKKGHVARFLNQRAKVKVTIMFRGREQQHPERGRNLLMRLAEDLKEIGLIESPPLQDGRNMVMVMAPTKNAGVKKTDAEAEEAQRSEEAVQADGDGQADAQARDEGAQPGAQEPEAEAAVRQGSAGVAGGRAAGSEAAGDLS
jgi:translation initiation factor IF-3